MRLTNKRLYTIIGELIGEKAIPVVKYLKDRKNVSEFVIAEKTKLDMQSTRNILYKLHNYNIATYVRKKDRKKGWYISYWTFHKKRVKEFIEKLKKERLAMLMDRLKKEEENRNAFFVCPKACTRLEFDQATEFNFRCPECGTLLYPQDNSKTIAYLKQKIKELKEELKN